MYGRLSLVEDKNREKKLEYVDRVLPSLTLQDAVQLADASPYVSAPKRRILVVDDEASITQTLRFNLEHAGYTVFCAFDGREAIDCAFKNKPDLILLDVMLPVVDGFAACAAIRAKSKVPIILLTAKDTENDKVVGFEVGATDYITKPFVLTDLLSRVRSFFTD